MNDEQRRIRGYLQAQGAKLSPAQIIDKVRAAMADLARAAGAVPAERFADAPSSGEWSANEVMAHVLAAGQRFGGDIVRVLDGRPVAQHVPGAPEAPPPRRTAVEWSSLLADDRERLFMRVARADPDARLEAAIDHGMFGTLNWRETLLFLRLHDLDHAGQLGKIAEALAASPRA
jgi:DinB family protein